MKTKSLLLIIGIVLVVSLSGCGSNTRIEYPTIPVSENKELGCVELVIDGITFRPFGTIGHSRLRGEQIGIREDTDNGIICEVKGYEATEWLIDYLDVFMGGGDTLYKAVGITEIPADLEQYQMYDF